MGFAKTLHLGIDIGTSGCRIIVVDNEGTNIASIQDELPASIKIQGHICQYPKDWWNCVTHLFKILLKQINPEMIKSLAVNGTSGSVLLIDKLGKPLSPCYMYNDNHNDEGASLIAEYAPQNSGAHGSSSGLAKCLSLLEDFANEPIYRCITQADWIAGKLLNNFDISDVNNSLKLGYDPVTLCWPNWLDNLPCKNYLPQQIYSPGTVIGNIAPQMASQYGFSPDVKIVAGTTDSIAAFIATGSHQIGDAVTSLGSTLAIKVLNDKPIFAPEFGVYSHRLDDIWLVGGASNTGGFAIRKYFNQAEIDLLTTELNPEHLTGLDYYPLPEKGERFPTYDPEKKPHLTPRPNDNVTFFQGILEGIARIEKQSYDKLTELGAVQPKQIITMGGGSKNKAWQKIRENICQIPVISAIQSDAAYGSALLAKRAYESLIKSNNQDKLVEEEII